MGAGELLASPRVPRATTIFPLTNQPFPRPTLAPTAKLSSSTSASLSPVRSPSSRRRSTSPLPRISHSRPLSHSSTFGRSSSPSTRAPAGTSPRGTWRVASHGLTTGRTSMVCEPLGRRAMRRSCHRRQCTGLRRCTFSRESCRRTRALSGRSLRTLGGRPSPSRRKKTRMTIGRRRRCLGPSGAPGEEERTSRVWESGRRWSLNLGRRGGAPEGGRTLVSVGALSLFKSFILHFLILRRPRSRLPQFALGLGRGCAERFARICLLSPRISQGHNLPGIQSVCVLPCCHHRSTIDSSFSRRTVQAALDVLITSANGQHLQQHRPTTTFICVSGIATTSRASDTCGVGLVWVG